MPSKARKKHLMSRLISKAFIARYVVDYFKRPRQYVTDKEYQFFLMGRTLEPLTILVLWGLSKLPIIGPRSERTLAQIITKWWSFKPIPEESTLSPSALEYKKEKSIEVIENIDVETKILDLTTLHEVLDRFPFTHVSNCGCRAIIQHCDAPLRVCLTVRWVKDISKGIPDNSEHRICTREEIDDVIEQSDKFALVHMALNYPNMDHPYHICACCSCCCIGFREFIAHAVPLLVGSKFIAKIDEDKCTGCFHCVNHRCRFGAILIVNEDNFTIDSRKEDKKRFKIKYPKWSEDRRGWGTRIRPDPPNWEKIKLEHTGKWYAKVNPYRCFGCGLCASEKYGCPEKAIKLYPREKKL